MFSNPAEASSRLSMWLRSRWAGRVPGCTFLVTRNGEVLADGSVGWARGPWDAAGPLPMSADAIVHIASMSKSFCSAGILALIEDWNDYVEALKVVTTPLRFPPLPGHPRSLPSLLSDPLSAAIVLHSTLAGSLASDMKTLLQTAAGTTQPPSASTPPNLLQNVLTNGHSSLDLNSAAYPLLQPLLLQSMITGYGGSYPGKNVAAISLGQLIVHDTTLRQDDPSDADLGVPHDQVSFQPDDGSRAVFDLPRYITAFLRADADGSAGYNNQNYNMLGAVIQAATGVHYRDWIRQRLLNDPALTTLDRKPSDPSLAAHYYTVRSENRFTAGVPHPDYTDFGAAGGWYCSARQMCDWLYRLCSGKPVGGRVLLKNAVPLLKGITVGGNSFGPLLGGNGSPYPLGRLRGSDKDGGTSVGGGGTNGRMVVLKGYGEEYVCAFCLFNCDGPADGLLDEGLVLLQSELTRRPAPIAAPAGVQTNQLLRAVCWEDNGALQTATELGTLSWSSPVLKLNATSASRQCVSLLENLLPGRTKSDGTALDRNAVLSVELRGGLMVHDSGLYRFRIWSDDGCVMFLDDSLLVEVDYDQGLWPHADSPAVRLEPGGYYPLRLRWYNSGGGGALYLQVKGPHDADFRGFPPGDLAVML